LDDPEQSIFDFLMKCQLMQKALSRFLCSKVVKSLPLNKKLFHREINDALHYPKYNNRVNVAKTATLLEKRQSESGHKS
jgi:hypothetical protein